MSTYDEVWKTLSRVDVSEHIEDKNGLSYLSWAWAWGTLMEYYPSATFSFSIHEGFDTEKPGTEVLYYPDGTGMVECKVMIGECSREMWLPIMDYRNKAIANPDARSVSDTKMRCLTKCLALFGLGHSLYAGSDLPMPPIEIEGKPPKKKAAKKKKEESEENKEDSETKVANGVVTTYETFLQTAKDMDELKGWWMDNRVSLKELEGDLPETYKAVLTAFTARKNQLKEV